MNGKDAGAPDYSRMYQDKKYADLSRVSTFRKMRSMKQPGRLLDIACGIGYLLDYMGGGTGIDWNPDLIEEAKKAYPKNEFIASDCYAIPLPDEQFDTITMCMIFEHLDEPEKALREARRLLKNGGNLIIVTPRRNDLFYRLFVPKDPTHVKEYTVPELKNVVAKFFSIKTVTYGTVSTKIPAWATYLFRSDIIVNCKKS